MKARILLCVAVLALVAAVPGSEVAIVHQCVGDGEIVEMFATADGGAAIVMLEDWGTFNMREVWLRLVHTTDDGVWAQEVVLPYSIRPEQIVVRAWGRYVHVALQWMENDYTFPKVHYYRFELPCEVINTVFLPVVEGGNGADIEVVPYRVK